MIDPETCYTESEETQHLISNLLGETSTSTSHGKPVRTLKNFVILDANNEPVSPFEHDFSDSACRGEGFTQAIVVDDDEDEEDEDIEYDDDGRRLVSFPTIRIKTSDAFRFTWDDTPGIWLETQYAWYRLVQPHPDHASSLEPNLVAQYLLSLFCSITTTDEPQLASITSLESLADALEYGVCVRGCIQYIGRTLKLKDIETHVSSKEITCLRPTLSCTIR